MRQKHKPITFHSFLYALQREGQDVVLFICGALVGILLAPLIVLGLILDSIKEPKR